MSVAMQYGSGNYSAESYKKSSGGGGGGSSWTSLWTNADPSSNFAAQTVSVDLSGYSVIAIKYCAQTGQGRYACSMVIKDGDSYYVTIGINSTSNNYYYKRGASADSSGVTFTTGYRNTSESTSYAIPVAIYGVC